MTAPNWPESVPVLTAEDIHRGSYHGPDETHCLYGWCMEVCGHSEKRDLWNGSVAQRLGAELQKTIGPGWMVSRFNDRNPPAKVAEVWNATMRRLGYTEVVDA